MTTLTQARLKELLHYDQATGLFTWKISRGKAVAGGIAGTLKERGYIQICLDGQLYRAHRLAFLYVLGRMPPHGVDHADGNPSNNRWMNLRSATQAQNTLNRRASTRSKTGVKNVTTHPDCGFVVRMMTPQGYAHLGCFKTLSEAASFAEAARKKHHGDFASYERHQ